MDESDEEKKFPSTFDEIERKVMQIKSVRVPDLEEQINDFVYTIKHMKMTVAAIQGTAQYVVRALRELKEMVEEEKGNSTLKT